MKTEISEQITHPSRRFQTYFLLFLFIALKAFGNLALAWGTKHFPHSLSGNPLIFLLAMLDPFISAGILLQIFALLTRMALLSRADLTFIVPMTAIGYVLSALFGMWFLQEKITAVHWLGTLIIFGGAALVAFTPQQSTGEFS